MILVYACDYLLLTRFSTAIVPDLIFVILYQVIQSISSTIYAMSFLQLAYQLSPESNEMFHAVLLSFGSFGATCGLGIAGVLVSAGVGINDICIIRIVGGAVVIAFVWMVPAFVVDEQEDDGRIPKVDK